MTVTQIGEYATTGKPLPGGAVSYKEWASTETLPTAYNSTLSGYSDLGELTEDGFAWNRNISRSTIKGWSNVPLITTLDEYASSYAMSFMEVRASALSFLFGTVTGSDGSAIQFDDTPAGLEKTYIVVCDMLFEDGRIARCVIPKGKINNINTTNFKQGEAVAFPCEVQAMAGGFADNPKATARWFLSAPGAYTEPAASSSSSSSGTSGTSGTSGGGN